MKRVFIIGNGVSIDVASAPSSRELIPKIEEYFKNEPHEDRNEGRIHCFMRLSLFLEYMKNNLKKSMRHMEKYRDKFSPNGDIFSPHYLYNDIEVLLSLIELSLVSPPTIQLVEEGVHWEPYEGTYFPGLVLEELKMIKRGIKTYLFELLRPERIKDEKGILREFCRNIVKKGDSFITMNYDLLLEQALWSTEKWTPYDGYIVGKISDEKYMEELEKKNRISSDVKILKLHGSLNWDGGPFERRIEIKLFRREDGISYFEGLTTIGVPRVNGKYIGGYDSLTIVPSYIKLFPNPELRKLWKIAAQEVSSADEIYLIGYSLPKADMLVDFLLSYINPKSKVIIVNPDAKELKNSMVCNYGELNIESRPVSFSEFVNQN